MSTIGFIGSGNMAEALVKGLIASKKFNKKDIIISDISKKRLSYMSSEYGLSTTDNNREVAEKSEIIVFAVKPNILTNVLDEIKNSVRKNKLYVSIAAGVKSSTINKAINKKLRFVRVMPNTPCLVLEGASAIFFNEVCSDDDKLTVLDIFNSVGKAYEVSNEEMLDAVTGLSGSGPAFVSIFIESLSDAGVKMGLSRKLASDLAIQTVLGTSKMIFETDKHPAELKDMVASPGGTTIRGVSSLEKEGFRNAVVSAVESATLRSIELSKED
ncbi:MAG: pyrroline-5-carboxylate reductase [Candidatus Dadabacteria bacterium]|nr:pyrroline-5-carboxylate reductase [Candidatus Dadabacteria bacterium]NIQ16304.1 pyrroline-5-carboxylate reductase [Candidatus Dadabacteria bacterium]